jgi:3D (Asp-Asp-Asp) domain-containing protein
MKYDLGKDIKRRLLPAAALLCICLLLAANLHGWHRYYDAMSAAMQTGRQSSCSDGWYITGYYVPREDELPGDAEQIDVERVGSLSFSQEFLNETRTEGWGITRFGWALGYYSGGWHRSDAGPLDAAGNLLTDGAIAIDRSLIPHGAQVQISTLPSPWASKTFRATDIGVGIVGQHIDVFTGTGRNAEQETFRITSDNNRVCFTSNARPDTPRDGF